MGDSTPKSAYEVLTRTRKSPRDKIARPVSPTEPDPISPKKVVVQEASPTKSQSKVRRHNVSASQEIPSASNVSASQEIPSPSSVSASREIPSASNVSASQERPLTSKRKMDSEENVNGVTEQKTVAKKKRGRKKVIEDTITNGIETINSVIPQNFIVQNTNVKRARKTNENMSVIPKTSAEFNIAQLDGLPCGNKFCERIFKWLIAPVELETFFENFWEKIPLHMPRSDENVFKHLFSSADVDKIIKENDLICGEDIDVLTYVDGKRQPVDSDLKVTARFVWKCYQEGNSVRMRNPQVFHQPLWNLCSHLQEYLTSYVGVNMYLTPPGEQGFPPHFDDIDAFVLQIEGKKHWKFYKARDNCEILARYSSGDLDEESLGKPFMEIDLLPGDALYFPRGWIHEAKAADDSHSLHLTLSANQLNTWGDLLKAGIPHAVEQAMKNDIEFRKTLPKDYLDFAGSANSNPESNMGQAFNEKVVSLAEKALKYFSVDHATDVHAVDFIHGSLPPDFNEPEKDRSIYGNIPSMKDGKVLDTEDITLDTEIRLIRKRSFRLTVDEDGARFYYNVSNTRNHKEVDAALYLDVDTDLVPAINFLFKIHPSYVKVLDLPVEDPEVRLQFACQLYDSGFLMTKDPLPLLSEDDS